MDPASRSGSPLRLFAFPSALALRSRRRLRFAPVNPKWVSALGLGIMLLLAWAVSENRRRFPFRVVFWGLFLQVSFALLILRTDTGRRVFTASQAVVERFIGFAGEGTGMLFGPLGDRALLESRLGPGQGVILALSVLGTIVLVSAVSSALYHYGVLQLLVRGIAWAMRRTMGTSGSETLSAAANIFMGQTEAPLVIRPYLATLTRSEILAMMTGGMATIATSVLGAYVSFGIPAGHLLTASVLSAPASLLIAKIMLPETEASPTAGGATAKVPRETVNGIDALCQGAADGLKLALNVIAMLIAFVAVIAALNWILAGALSVVGIEMKTPLQAVFGQLNRPFAWLLGIPARDCEAVGALLGERIVLNEFVGYLHLSQLRDSLDPRSYLLAVYALCGFANFGSIAIQIGGIGTLMPLRRAELARLGFRSMAAGLLACYVTACVVGMLL